MDTTRARSEEINGGQQQGAHIWLRYSTQFVAKGRTHTLEIGIPVPLGASAETREQLIREAEAGMNQLTQHMEGRVARMIEREGTIPASNLPIPPLPAQSMVQSASAPRPTSKPPVAPTAPVPVSVGPSAVELSRHERTPAPIPTPVATPAPTPPFQPMQNIPPTRSTVGAAMPSMPYASGTPTDASGNISLPLFIQHIKEVWGLTPKQAMDMLKVKSLNGLNLREATDQLGHMLSKSSAAEPVPQAQVTHVTKTAERPTVPPLPPTASAPSSAFKPLPSDPPMVALPPDAIPVIPPEPEFDATPTMPMLTSLSSLSSLPTSAFPQPEAARETLPFEMSAVNEPTAPYRFDEEIDIEDLEDGEEAEQEQNEDEDTSSGLTPHQRITAKNVLDDLKEAKGASPASNSRQVVLQNVISGQLSNEQLLQIIQGVWNVPTTKKLKNEQAEALISWAKKDEFITEAELLLRLLEEEAQYARSDR